jgi:hypothetical protein
LNQDQATGPATASAHLRRTETTSNSGGSTDCGCRFKSGLATTYTERVSLGLGRRDIPPALCGRSGGSPSSHAESTSWPQIAARLPRNRKQCMVTHQPLRIWPFAVLCRSGPGKGPRPMNSRGCCAGLGNPRGPRGPSMLNRHYGQMTLAQARSRALVYRKCGGMGLERGPAGQSGISAVRPPP